MSHSYCGALGPLLPEGMAAQHWKGDCFFNGVLLLIPFTLPVMALLTLAIQGLLNCRSKGDYHRLPGNIQEEHPDGEEEEVIEETSQTHQFEPAAWVLILLDAHWILAFGLMGTGLIELAALVVLEHFEWFQLLSPIFRALGIALSLSLNIIAGNLSPRVSLLAINCIIWLLCTVSGVIRLWPNTIHHPLPLLVAYITYVILSALLTICDGVLVGWFTLASKVQQCAPVTQSGTGLFSPVPRSTVVAKGLRDPGLVFLHDRVNFLSRVLCTWMTRLLQEAYHQPISMAQLGKIPASDSALMNVQGLYTRWCEQLALDDSLGGQASLQWPIWQQYGWPMFRAFVCKLVADLLGLIGPMALKGIVQFMQDHQSGEYTPPTEATFDALCKNGWVLAGILFLSSVLQTVLMQYYYFLTLRVCSNVQSGLTSLIYWKALQLNTDILPPSVTAGSIVSHASVDVSTIGLLFQLVLYCFTVPFQIGTTLFLLYWNIGWAGPASVGVVLLLLPIQLGLGQMSARFQKRVLKSNDGRLKLLSELLQGIKVVKFYAWERVFVDRVTMQRGQQLQHLLHRKLAGAGTLCLALSTPSLISVTGFGLFLLWSSQPLTAGMAFSALSLFNILLVPMIVLPSTINAWINALVSSHRIMKFLMMPTMNRSFHHVDRDATQLTAVQVAGTFKWDIAAQLWSCNEEDPGIVRVPSTPGSFAPFHLDLSIPRGSLTMVVGAVGSGKSTLLKVILGDVPCEGGEVWVHGQVAYASQQPTIFNATVRDNILFGLPFDEQWYEEVLLASGLAQDVELFLDGDITMIGEKGVTLSGGQKQRVSIARALYSAADVVILDDPLSALDAHVAEHVFHKAIMGLLIDTGKTVIMTTHQWQYLKHANNILLMKHNAISARGTMDQLANAGIDLHHETYHPAAAAHNDGRFLGSFDGEAALWAEELFVGSCGGSIRPRVISRGSTNSSFASLGLRSHGKARAVRDEGHLMHAEEREVGAVEWRVYRAYFRAAGLCGITLLVVAQTAAKGLGVVASLFLSHWSTDGASSTPSHPVGYYLGAFTGVTLASALVSAAGNVIMGLAAVKASKALHRATLDRVIRCPMAFFDSTPLGRILNRFSNDMQNIDMLLPDTLNQWFQMILNLLCCIITLAAVNPILTLFLVPLTTLYWLVQHLFRCTSRELQRLNNISKSPILAHLSETLGSVATIRTYGAGPRFMGTAMQHVDNNALAFLFLASANWWLGLRLGILGAAVVAGTAYTSLWHLNTLSPGLSGLSLSYALSFVGYVGIAIRSFADAEMQMSSVERISQYLGLDTEMPTITPSTTTTISESWPQQGSIIFRGVDATYRPGLPCALKGVTLTIQAGQRIGVCGRTGSGKTSLLLSLFRMLHVERGSIIVDGVDISTLPLPVLRSRMAVIPQDPVLFAGTVRSNLDPIGQYPDSKLWAALRAARLDDTIQSLDDMVGENAEGFSAGQRQLLCLARAFIKQRRILCLDEATASMDQETDRIVQGLLRSAFARCTVITIAHRISTIMDYDKVLVLGAGQVLEFNSPEILLQTDSVFKSLVDAATTAVE